MKILITGANGQLGRSLQEVFNEKHPETELIALDRAELDFEKDDIHDRIQNFMNITHIVNCAAFTNVDLAETEKEKALKINAHVPFILAKLAREKGCKLIHISTDFVYSGKENTPLEENSPTNPVNYYGFTKLKGDRCVLEENLSSIVIRTQGLFSPYGDNFIAKMIKLGLSGKKEVFVVNDQVCVPTSAKALAEAIEKIIVDGCLESGIFHFSSQGVCSKYDTVREIFDFLRSKGYSVPVLRTASSALFPTPAKRPHYSIFNLDKINRIYGINPPYWRDSLRNELPGIFNCLQS